MTFRFKITEMLLVTFSLAYYLWTHVTLPIFPQSSIFKDTTSDTCNRYLRSNIKNTAQLLESRVSAQSECRISGSECVGWRGLVVATTGRLHRPLFRWWLKNTGTKILSQHHTKTNGACFQTIPFWAEPSVYNKKPSKKGAMMSPITSFWKKKCTEIRFSALAEKVNF